jgi:hypothetical protein
MVPVPHLGHGPSGTTTAVVGASAWATDGLLASSKAAESTAASLAPR